MQNTDKSAEHTTYWLLMFDMSFILLGKQAIVFHFPPRFRRVCVCGRSNEWAALM
jgi:hypothetical protein